MQIFNEIIETLIDYSNIHIFMSQFSILQIKTICHNDTFIGRNLLQ